MSFLVLSDEIIQKLYTSDIPESNKQKGIQCFKFFEMITALRKKKENQFRIVYVCETEELAKSLKLPNCRLTLLASSSEDRHNSVCCFIIDNKDIPKIRSKLLDDYASLVGNQYSLFASNMKKDVISEDLEYLNTLNISFKYLIDDFVYSWRNIR